MSTFLSCGKEFHAKTWLFPVNPFPNKPWFLRVCSTSLLKTLWEKEKLIVTSNFSFSHSVFLPVWRTFCHFHQIQNCRQETISVWKSLKFVVWERVKNPVLTILTPKICFLIVCHLPREKKKHIF